MNNNVLEFFVKMKDLASSGLAKVAQNGKQAFSSLQNYITQTKDKNEELGNSFDKLGKKVQNSSNGIGGLVKSLATYASIGAALTFGGSSIQAAMDFGATKQSFQVLTGSKEKGDALSGGLNKLSQDTILGPEVFKNAQTMMGFGIGAEKVIPTLKMLGDVAMGDSNKLSSLTLAFSQVQAAGKLTGQDLLQMINAGFNPLNEISKTTGKSIGELKKEMEAGGITSNMVTAAFESATGAGGLYNNMLNKLAETPYGKMQQLMGAFEALKVKIGEALMPLATTFMTIAQFLMDHIEIVGAVGAAWATYSIITNAASVYTGILNAVMAANPMMLLIALIAGLIVWIISLTKKYDGWGKSLSAIWEVIKAFGQMAWIPFKQFGEASWYYIQMLWLRIKQFAESVIGIYANIGRAMIAALKGDFSGAKAALTAEIKTSAGKEIEELDKKHNANKAGYAAEFADAQKRMIDNMGKIGLTKKADAEGGTSLTAAGIKSKNSSVTAGSTTDKKDSVAGGITGSGPRVININGVKFTDKIEIHASSANQGIDQLEERMQQMFLRILNSGASIQ